MDNNEKIAYDLALIYAKTKFETMNSQGIIGKLCPKNEPDAELVALATLFNDAYNYYISHDIKELDIHNFATL